MLTRLFHPPLLFLLAIVCLSTSYAVYPAHADPSGGAGVHATVDAGAARALDAGDNGIGTSPSSPATTLPDPGNPGDFIAGMRSAASAGKWLLVLALICNAMVWLLRWGTPKILPKLGEWFGTDKGGTLLALTLGVLSVLVVQLQAGRFDGWMLASGLAAGLLSIGSYTAPKKAASTA